MTNWNPPSAMVGGFGETFGSNSPQGLGLVPMVIEPQALGCVTTKSFAKPANYCARGIPVRHDESFCLCLL